MMYYFKGPDDVPCMCMWVGGGMMCRDVCMGGGAMMCNGGGGGGVR